MEQSQLLAHCWSSKITREDLKVIPAPPGSHAEVSRHDTLQADVLAEKYFPDRPQTKVSLAINLALITESAERTTLLAANVGGDSDSVASIGAAIAGSLRPGTVNETWFRVVQSVNGDDLVEIGQALARLRCYGVQS